MIITVTLFVAIAAAVAFYFVDPRNPRLGRLLLGLFIAASTGQCVGARPAEIVRVGSP